MSEKINESINNIIEINGYNAFNEYEGQILSGTNIPSLLPFNIVINENKTSICFSSHGYRAISFNEIDDIESLCMIIKLFIQAIIESEQYLLVGARHFTETDMVFFNAEKNRIKLVYGQDDGNDYGYGDLHVVTRFICSLKSNTKDRVFLSLLENINELIKERNPMLRNMPIIIEEVERKWYCRSLTEEFMFGTKKKEYERTIN